VIARLIIASGKLTRAPGVDLAPAADDWNKLD